MTEPADDEENEMARGIAALFSSKGFDQSPKARRQKEKRIRAAVDGRSLRATGRTKQFNFMAKPETRAAAVQLARTNKLTLAELMERLIEKAMKEGL